MTTTTTARRMRSRAVPLGVTAVMALSLSGCGENDPKQVGICTDPQTHERVSDSQCDDGDNPRDYSPGMDGFFWYYIATQHSGYSIPPVGGHYDDSYGTYNGSRFVKSDTPVQRGGMPAKGVTSVKTFTKTGGFSKTTGVSKSGGFGGFSAKSGS